MIVVNDLIRGLVGGLVGPIGGLSSWWVRRGLGRYPEVQRALAEAYDVGPDTPIEGYGDETRARIERLAATVPETRIATTSGSTAEPKRIAFPPARVRRFDRTTRLAGLRAFAHAGLRRPDMLILSSLAVDDSFTSLVLRREGALPPWLVGLLDPGRYLRHPALVALAGEHGVTAARLWLAAVVDPPLLYATNPSTLAVLLDELHEDWGAASGLVRRYVGRDPELPLALLDRIAGRAGRGGLHERLARIAAAERPPPIGALLPGLQGFVSWDGGYVGVFLERVRRWLPADRYLHLPMYSMSTETLQTLPVAVDGALRFLPVAPGVLYELLPEEAPDDPSRLIVPGRAEAGATYTMVVSDPYGLRRYQTEDVFRVEAMVRGLPDLRFVRRRGLTWSFTGEKLTGRQLDLAFDGLRELQPELRAGQLTAIPVRALADGLPGYRIVLAAPGRSPLADDPGRRAGLARAFDADLARINDEYGAKRHSGRLAAPELVVMPYERLACALDTRTRDAADRAARAWESQFKLTPLCRTVWEEIDWP